MGKFDAAIPTAYTTASTLVVTTKDAILHGVNYLAGAAATVGAIVVHVANTTGAPVFGMLTTTSGGMGYDGPFQPVVCAGGMVVTCTGTAFNYSVHYSLLHP
jgi:hypothetical protein